MSVEVAASIWNLVHDSLPQDDREVLASSLLDILIDDGIEASDIEYHFSDYQEVIAALKLYMDGADYEQLDDNYEYDDDDEDW